MEALKRCGLSAAQAVARVGRVFRAADGAGVVQRALTDAAICAPFPVAGAAARADPVPLPRKAEAVRGEGFWVCFFLRSFLRCNRQGQLPVLREEVLPEKGGRLSAAQAVPREGRVGMAADFFSGAGRGPFAVIGQVHAAAGAVAGTAPVVVLPAYRAEPDAAGECVIRRALRRLRPALGMVEAEPAFCAAGIAGGSTRHPRGSAFPAADGCREPDILQQFPVIPAVCQPEVGVQRAQAHFGGRRREEEGTFRQSGVTELRVRPVGEPPAALPDDPHRAVDCPVDMVVVQAKKLVQGAGRAEEIAGKAVGLFLLQFIKLPVKALLFVGFRVVAQQDVPELVGNREADAQGR